MAEQGLLKLVNSLDSSILSWQKFVECSNWMLELNVRNVTLPRDLEIRVWYELSRFAAQKLRADFRETVFDSKEQTIERVEQMFEILNSQKSDDLLDVDDSTLLRLKIIHNELLFLRTLPELSAIPLEEVRFCLALFLLALKGDPTFDAFKLLLDRVNVMEFLDATVAALRIRDGSLGLVSKKYRKIFSALKRTHALVRTLYYLDTFLDDISAITHYGTTEEINTASLDRLLCKMKHDIDFLIIPVAVKQYFEPFFQAFKTIRAEEHLQELNEKLKLYQTFLRRIPIFEIVFELVRILHLDLVLRHFLRTARNCRSKERMCSLFRYVQQFNSIVASRESSRKRVIEFYTELQTQISSHDRLKLNTSEKLQFVNSLDVLNRKSSNFNLTRLVTLDEDSFKQLKSQIDLMLLNSTNESNYKTARRLWQTLEAEIEASKKSTKLLLLEEITPANSIQQFIQIEPGPSRSQPKLVVASTSNKLKTRALLKRYHCSTIDDLILNHSRVPPHVQLALIQLNFPPGRVDSLSLLRCGSSGLVLNEQYHDPSYHLAVSNPKLYCLICALVLAESSDIPEVVSEEKRFALEELQDVRFEGIKWSVEQKELLKSALEVGTYDSRQISKERFLFCLGKYDGLKYHSLDEIMRYKGNVQLGTDHQSRDSQLQVALNLMNFEEALGLPQSDVAHLDCRLFAWNDLIDKLVQQGENPSNWDDDTFNFVVRSLVQNINITSLATLLKLRPMYRPNDDLMLEVISTGCQKLFTGLYGTQFDLGLTEIKQVVANHMNEPVKYFFSNSNENFLEEILSDTIKSNNVEIAMLIIDRQPSLSTKALELSARFNRYRLALQVLEKTPETNRDTALFVATSKNHWKLAYYLLDHGANPHTLTKQHDSAGALPLKSVFHNAVASGCYKFVRKCSISDVTSIGDVGLTTLAAAAGSFRLVRYLLKAGLCAVPTNDLPGLLLKYSDIWRALLNNLSLEFFVFKNTEVTRWYNLLEQLKHLDYMKRLLSNDEFPQMDNIELRRLVLRKFSLYKSFDARFAVQAITTSLDGLVRVYDTSLSTGGSLFNITNSFQRKLEQYGNSLERKQFDLHFYSNNGENYAFVKLGLFVSESDSNDSSEVSVTLQNISRESINAEIQLFLLRNNLFPRYSYDARVFEGDTLIERYQQLQLGSDSCLVALASTNASSERHFEQLDQDSRAPLLETSQETRLQLAVSALDKESTRALLGRLGHPDHDDLWLDPELVHKVIDGDEGSARSRMKIAELLLNAGLRKWSQNPKIVGTLIERSISANISALAVVILTKECSGLTEFNQFRKVLQYDSVDAFKMFLEMNKFSDGAIFKHISNALLEFNTKRLIVGEKLHTYLLYKLSSYGFKHFCADPVTPKKPTEWLDSIDVIIVEVETLSLRSDCGDYLGVDNEVLLRLQTIHNQMYLIKHVSLIKEIPLRKVIFLLAVFLTTFTDESLDMYRMVINKPIIFEFLQLVAAQLKSFKRHHLKESNHEVPIKSVSSLRNTKKLLRKLNRVYYLVKQMYSLSKVVNTLEDYIPRLLEKQEASDPNHSRAQKADLIATVTRTFQIFGECIKNSDNSDNLPKKVYDLLSHGLTPLLEQNKRSRDKTCHNFPLFRKSFSVDEHFWNVLTTVQYLDYVRASVGSVVHYICSQFHRHLFGLLRGCNSLDRMRDLIRFVGDLRNASKLQKILLASIRKYDDAQNKYMSTVSPETIGPESQKCLYQYKIKNIGRPTVIFLLEAESSRFFYKYQEIQMLAFAAENVTSCHRALDINLRETAEYDPLEEIVSCWNMIVSDTNSLANVLTVGRSVLFLAFIQNRYEIFPKPMQEQLCQEETQQTLQLLLDGSGSSWDGEELKKELYRELDRGYFSNIFAVDAKAQAIKKVFTKLKIPLCKQKLKALREKDLAELQRIFDEIPSAISRVLTQHNCETIDKLLVNVGKIPTEAILAIEYYLLEMCEVLGTTKQFQDNFHTIKQGAQFICGRNFRNYLAHDGISYDLLTNSSRIKVLVNALVVSEIRWRLFQKPEKRDLKGLFDLQTVGIGWVGTQERLKRAVLDLDPAGVSKQIDEGGLLAGSFLAPLGPFNGLSRSNLSQVLLHSRYDELAKQTSSFFSILTMLDPSINVEKWETTSKEEVNFASKLGRGDFNNTSLVPGITSWGEMLSSRTFTFNSKLCLGRLLQHINSKEDIDTIRDILLWHGSEVFTVLLCIGTTKTRELILQEFVTDSIHFEKVHKIFIQHRIDFFAQLDQFHFSTFGNDHSKLLQDRLALAAEYNNFHIFENLLQVRTFEYTDQLVKTFLICAKFGQTAMIQLLLDHNMQLFSNLDEALQRASNFAHWRTARFLHAKGANPWQWTPLEISAANYAIKYGCSQVLRRFSSTVASAKQTIEQCLSYAAERGSVRMLRSLMSAGYDLWRDKFAFVAALQGQNESNVSFVKEKMFGSSDLGNRMHPGLVEWFRVLHECKTMRYLQNSGKLHTGHLANRLEDFCLLFDTLEEFCRIPNFGYVEFVGFNGEELSIDTHTELCNAVQDEIQRQHDLQPGSLTRLELFYTNGEDIITTVEVNFIPYYETPLAESLQSDHLTEYCYHVMEQLPLSQICTGILESLKCHYSSFSCNFSYNNQSYQLLKISSTQCLARLLQSPDTLPLKKLLNSQDSIGNTILHHLQATVSLKSFEQLILHGAELGVVNCDGKTALFQLLYPQFSWTTIKPIFEYCIRADIRDSKGGPIFETPSHFGETLFLESIRKGRLEVTEFLLEHCSHSKILKIPNNTLHVAGSHTFYRIAKLLVEHNPDAVHGYCAIAGQTPLESAILVNHAAMVQLLVDSGAVITEDHRTGCSAVELAIFYGSLESLRVVLGHAKRHRIDVLSYKKLEFTAFETAVNGDNVELLEILTEYEIGAKIDSAMDAESLRKLRKFLISEGYTNQKRTLFSLAVSSGKCNVTAYLEKCAKTYRQAFQRLNQ